MSGGHRLVDLTNKRFGALLVKGRAPSRNGATNAFWYCTCDCGETRVVCGSKLVRGRQVSCGCKCGNKKPEDLTGKRFKKLVVLRREGRNRCGNYKWLCQCDCGKRLVVFGSNLKRGQAGCRCVITGENHYRWKAGEEAERRRNTHRNLELGVVAWRNSVFQKDGFVCRVCCYASGGILNAHHLNAWDSFPEERLDLDNGITLCSKCHNDFHSRYGFGGNTKEQFAEYIGEVS